MVAIFTGLGAGLAKGSGSTLGGSGEIGSAASGRAGEGVSVNAATGNLVVSRQDEFLSGPGLDIGISRTYNSLAEVHDGDNGDKWQMSTARRVFGLSGAVNTVGSSVRRVGGDGSVATYIYETRNGTTTYFTTDGEGAHDRLTYSGGTWLWTDGATQVTETYEGNPNAAGQWRIARQTDTTGQAVTFSYNGAGQLSTVNSGNGEYLHYTWDGARVASIHTGMTNPATGGFLSLARVWYGYDAANRLSSVTVDLSFESYGVGDGDSYTIGYEYGANGLISAITQKDGSRTDITYDESGRVIRLVEHATTGNRATSLAYGASFTDVTAPDGQVTRLEFSTGGAIANPLQDWGYGGVSRERAEALFGEAGFKYTSSPGADWSGISAGLSAQAGETYKFSLSMQAVPGHSDVQSLGLYGNTTGWGEDRFMTARIVSGPGRIEKWPGAPGLWKVSGLSTTEATRIEIIRTYDRAEGGGAYVYVDHPSGFRDGQQLIAAGASLEKLAEDNYSLHAIEHWGNGGTTRQPAGTIGGLPAMLLTSAPGADWSASSIGIHARQGETVKWRFLLQAVAGSSDSQTIGLYGNSSGWGDALLSSARIVSGPGTIRQHAGGLWDISGLSTGQATEIEIIRTYDRDEYGGAYAYVDLLGGFRDGQQIIHAARSLSKFVDSARSEKQLTRIIAPPAHAGAAQQVQEFNYDKDGNLVRTVAPDGTVTSYTYDEHGNVTAIDNPIGSDVRRWYDGGNRLILEETIGSSERATQDGHYHAYAYDTSGRLRYKVAPDGWVTEYRHDGYGRVLEEIAYRSQTFTQTIWINEGMLNSWRDGLGDRHLRNITSHRYDARGNLAYSYEWASSDGAGNYTSADGYTLTYYTYDHQGRLLATNKTGQYGQAFAYDGLGRTVASSDGAGGVTTVHFDDTNARTVMRLSTGLTRTLTYNRAGDLISQVESAPGANTARLNTSLAAHWGSSTTQRSVAGSYYAMDAERFYWSEPQDWRGISSGFSVAAGDTVRFRITLRSDGTSSSHQLGLYGNSEGWGGVGDYGEAIIVNGPGRLTQSHGGLWLIEGLSTGTETTVEIVRTFHQAQGAGAYLYAGGSGGWTGPVGMILSYPSIVKTQADANTAIATETTHAYDLLGRLRVSLDNFDNGNRTYYVYDKAGRLTGELNDYGDLTEYSYDSRNRLIGTARYVNSIDTGYLAQLQNPNNTITIAQLRPPAHGQDFRQWTVYDAAGRVIQQIDGTGGVTAFEYDGLGRVVRETAYHHRVSVAGFAGSPPLAPVAVSPDGSLDGTTRTFYDRQGNVRGRLDGEGYLTENVYDAAGRLIETIAYAQEVPGVYRANYTFADIRNNAAPHAANNRRTRYVYDGADRLRYVVDAANRVTETVYDAAGNAYLTIRRVIPISVSNYDFATVKNAVASHGDDRATYTYRDLQGRVSRTTDAAGLNTYYAYDAAGNVARTQIGDGAEARVTRSWHDSRGDLRYSVDAEGYLTRYSYSVGGRLTRVSRFDTPVSVSDATAIHALEALTNGGVTMNSYYYDNVGRLIYEYNGNNEYTEYAYSRVGQAVHIYRGRTNATHAHQAITHRYYDAAGRLYAQYDGVGDAEQTSAFTYYNGRGLAIRSDDGRGKISYSAYDRRGLAKEATDAAGGVTRVGYNAFGEIAVSYDARGNGTTHSYDTLGRLIRTVDAGGYATDYGYGPFGDLESVTRAGATTSFGYDKMGRLVRTTDALGHSETHAYNQFGDRIRTTNKLGGVTQFTYDRLGRMRTEWVDTTAYNDGGAVTAYGFYKNVYEYDAHGNVLRRIEAQGLAEQRITSFAYDRANRLLSETGQVFLGMTPVTQYAYDPRGNLTAKTLPGGGRTVYFYDDLDRVTVEISATGTYTSYAYDGNGNVVRARVYEQNVGMHGNGGSEEQIGVPGGAYRETLFEYDALDRVTKSTVTNVEGRVFDGANFVSQGYGLETRYEYDANGNVVRTWDANGFATHAYYDALNRKWAQIDQAGYRTDWSYDANGNVTRERRYAALANGGGAPPYAPADDQSDRITDYGYDAMGNRRTETRYWVLTHDGAGNHYWNHAQTEYVYNALGQVTVKYEATREHVVNTYDTSGRLMQETRSGYTDFGGAGVNPTVLYHYDATGNLVRMRQAGNGNAADRVTTYGYDGGKLRWTADAEVNDGDGRDGKLTYYWYDVDGNAIYEYYTRYDSNGNHAQGSAYDAIRRSYDAEGRVVMQWTQLYGPNGWYDTGPATTTTYNSFGEVVAIATGGGAARYFQYDAGGRMTGNNATNGVWEYYAYDKNGNRTATVTSGGGDIANTSFAWALGQSGRSDINASYTTYDARNAAVAVHEYGRDLSEGVAGQTLVTRRGYNAFGDVAYEIAADGGRIDYAYNTMGRLIRIENPWVTVQNEDGGTASIRPTEHFYYDIAGRLTGQRDANGNLTRMTLLAGTGYNGTQALATSQTNADGGVRHTWYDAHGDARLMQDEMGRRTSQAFDQLGRAIEVYNQASGLVDTYTFDGAGNQLTHSNNVLGSWNAEASAYDHLGRVVSQRAFGGDTATTSYAWHGTIGSHGGWRETTTHANSIVTLTDTDLFGRTIARRDMGGRAYSYAYDAAGRLASVATGSSSQSYTYYNTGKLRSGAIHTDTGGGNWTSLTTTYGYDRVGNLVLQRTVDAGQESYYYGYNYGYEPEYYYNNWSRTTQSMTAQYDALGRMIAWAEAGNSATPAASGTHSYDAAGNIRNTRTTYRPLDAQGNEAGYSAVQDYWYRYDTMNRVVVSKGERSGGTIVRGYQGADIRYDVGGQRTQVVTSKQASSQYWVSNNPYELQYEDPYYGGGYDPYGYGGYNQGYWDTVYYTVEVREDYSYDGAGRVSQVSAAEGSFDTYGWQDYGRHGGYSPQDFVYAPGNGVLRGSFQHDAMGRLTGQTDYTNGSTVAYSRSLGYDAAGRLAWEDSSTRRGNDTFRSYTTNYYLGGTQNMLGAANYSITTNWKNGSTSGTPGTRTDNSYVWWDGAVQSQVRYDENTGSSSNAIFTSNYRYDGFGRLTSATINDGRARTVSYTSGIDGQVIRRDERDNNHNTGDPHEVYYRFGGKQLGVVGNNGTDNTSYAASIAQRTATPGTGAFRNGATYGGGHADFGQDYDAINSFAQGGAGGSYTARGGDSLQSIAAQLWGDAGLWYKLAQANGLSGSGEIPQGRTLVVPAGVQRVHHNAGTFKPYDPAEAIGDTSPTTPKPQVAKKNKCGVVGAILLAVVAVAVTVVTSGALAAASIAAAGGGATSVGAGLAALAGTATASGFGISAVGAVAIGATAAATGSIVSQGLGVASGIQEKFNWKAVGMAALSGGIGGGLGASGVFGRLGLAGGQGLRGALHSAARGSLSSLLNQGIGVATGLQDKFSWAGVAAAGVGAGMGQVADGLLNVRSFDISRSLRNVGANALAGGARLIANAATLSAIEGRSFGDNALAALPDSLAQTVGSFMTAKLIGQSVDSQNRRFLTSLGMDAREANTVLKAIGSISPQALRSVANAGETRTNDETAEFMVRQLDIWEAEIVAGDRSGVAMSDFRAFKRNVAFHLIAADAYKPDGANHILPSGYSRIPSTVLDSWGLTSDLLTDTASGFGSAIYMDAQGGAIIAFRGTEPTDINDIKTDIYQHAGMRAAQYEYLSRNLSTITSRVSDVLGPQVVFTGHSLGGGLATLAGLMSGRATFAVAPAPLHQRTLDRYQISEQMIANANIQYSAVLGEPLQATGRNWSERSANRGYIANSTLGLLEGKTFFFGERLKSYPATLESDNVVSPSFSMRMGLDPIGSHSVIHNGLSVFYTGATGMGLGTAPWFWDWNVYGD